MDSVSLTYPKNSSWLEIDASKLRSNIEAFRSVSTQSSPSFRVGTVLKGNAYGHGLVPTLAVVHGLVDVLYVITPQDALVIRAFESTKGRPPCKILVLGATEPEEAVLLASKGVDMVVGDTGWDRMGPVLRQAGLVARVHVHIDSGLGREGFAPAHIPQALAFLKRDADVFDVVGSLSHFANTEDVTEQSYALEQLQVFERGCEVLCATLGVASLCERHFAASAASLVLPPARFDCVRIGLGLYGLWPSSETRLSAKIVLPSLPALKPVLSWRCRSQAVKWLPAGSYVGYGCTYRCDQDTRVAVLPVGYFDGYPRLLSSKAHVLVGGVRAPVLGRVMMNHIVVDVTRATKDDSPLLATLVGSDGPESLSVETLAGWAQTINYEFVTRLGAHLQRIVIET